MPTLIVVRHAKADSPLGTPDADRPLSPRGTRDAKAAGDALRAGGRRPDRVICSTALRARQTVAGLDLDSAVTLESRVYGADVDDLLDLLREQVDDPGVLLLVGHNPSLHELVLSLTGAPGDRFPTSATAVITFEGAWSELTPGTGRLVSIWTPRGPLT
jgi:phosphohistidine phosphatase